MILGIIFLFIAILSAYNAGESSNPFGWGKAIGAFIVVALIYGAIILGWRGFKRDSFQNNSYEYKEILIQSLISKNESVIGGTFILGCGSVSGGSRDHYITYALYPEGALRIKLDASRVYVRESNSETPKILNFYRRRIWKGYKSAWVWNSKPSVGEWTENDWVRTGWESQSKIIIVPEGTIYKEFKIEE